MSIEALKERDEKRGNYIALDNAVSNAQQGGES